MRRMQRKGFEMLCLLKAYYAGECEGLRSSGSGTGSPLKLAAVDVPKTSVAVRPITVTMRKRQYILGSFMNAIASIGSAASLSLVYIAAFVEILRSARSCHAQVTDTPYNSKL